MKMHKAVQNVEIEVV